MLNLLAAAILQTVESTAQGRESTMQTAFQDLEGLMIKAKEMVSLAAELNEKLSATSSAREEPEEATFIRSSLTQLGLHMDNAPVTLDMIKDEKKWNEELARELARVLQGGLMRDRGIIALDEVWGGWNRARGVALIPPSTFLSVLPLLPTHTSPPIHTRKFPSGLTVLHTPHFSASAFAARVAGWLLQYGEESLAEGGKTTVQIAQQENMSVSLAKEMMEVCENEGDVVRDDVGEAGLYGSAGVRVGVEVGVRWWPNLFVGYVWDGQVFEDEELQGS